MISAGIDLRVLCVCIKICIMVKIVSINVRSLSDVVKRKAVFEQNRGRADILIMQETHSIDKCEDMWRNEWGGEVIFSHGTSSARGTAVFLKKSLMSSVSNIARDEEGRQVIFDFKIDEVNRITIAAIYAPNSDSPNFFKNLESSLMYRETHKIVIGDFNLTLNVDSDRLNTYHNNNKAKEVVENLMEHFSLRDVWRVQNEERREYSWFKRGNLNMASRIDLALVSAGLDQSVKTVLYVSSIKTDHRAIYMVVDFHQQERGNGYWKLNTQYLRDKAYVDGMNRELDNSIRSLSDKSPTQLWESIKKRIKKFSVNYAKTRVQEEKIIIANLAEKVNEYESSLPLTEEDDELLEKTRFDLEEKVMKRAEGMLFRSKARWYEEGEKSTKYFFALEKQRYNAKTCYKIIDEDGSEYTNQETILEIQRKFYTELYRDDPSVYL